MRSIFLLILLSNIVVAAEPDAALRARVALALAFAPPTYAEQYAKALREKKPLVVFVGQPVKHIGNSVCVACESFPDSMEKGVVIGLPDGTGLRRVDLAGEPTVTRIESAIAESRPDRRSTQLPVRTIRNTELGMRN